MASYMPDKGGEESYPKAMAEDADSKAVGEVDSLPFSL